MDCPACGKDNPEDSRFCGSCGVSLIVSTASGIGVAASELPKVSFRQAVELGFKNYFKFSGRATRAEYWWWILFTVIGRLVFGIIDGLVSLPGVLGLLFGLGTLIPSLTVGVRRLHDINRTGWWLLLIFVPVIGWIVLIVWAIERGDMGPNKYDPDPRQATSQQPYKPQ